MKKKLLGVVFLVIAVVCVVSAAREGGSKALLGGIVAGVIFAVLGIRQLGLLSKKPTPARQAARRSRSRSRRSRLNTAS